MKILLIDDDKASMRYYIQALSDSIIGVEHCRDTDEALFLLEDRIAEFDLIVLDSALAPGKAFTAAPTDAGTSTGKFLFQAIRKSRPDIPVIILTNFFGLDWVREARKHPNVCAESKVDMLPSELVEKVKEMVKAAKG